MNVLQLGTQYLALRRGNEEGHIVVILKDNHEEATQFGLDEQGEAVANYYKQDIESYLTIGQGEFGSKNHYNIPLHLGKKINIVNPNEVVG